MSLANLTLRGMDRYGAIEQKLNANKFVTKGFLGSLTLITVLLFAYMLLPAEQEEKVLGLIKRLAEIGPPPTVATKETSCAGFSMTTGQIKSSLGIPVPVPDLQAPTLSMPDLNAPIVVPGLSIRGTGGIISEPPPIIHANPDPIPAPMPGDDPDVFVPVDQEPIMISDLASLVIYPEVAKRSGLEGKVIISALVDEDGRVTRTRIEHAEYEVFSQAAIDAVLKLRFKPALQGTEPVKLWVTIPILFKLGAK